MNTAQRTQSRVTLSRIATLAALLAIAGSASAQFAIGQGNALDRNMRRGDASVNPRGRDYQAEMRFRDAIVTGNAAGGFSFRGDAGYGAAADFRSSVASDTTYGFRRDSIVSGLGGLGVRGTDAIQYQYALTTGNALPNQFTGSMRTRRFGGGLDQTGVPSIPSPNDETADVLSPAIHDDMFRNERGAFTPVRSTSAYTTTKSYMPTLVTAFGTADGRAIAQTASPLRGIESFEMGRVEDLRPDLIPQGLRPRGVPGESGDKRDLPGSVPTVRDEPGLNLNAELMRRYDAYLGRQEDADGKQSEEERGWRDNLGTIRDYLNQPLPDLTPAEDDVGEGEERAPGPSRRGVPGLDSDMLDLLRKAPGRVDSLLLTDPDQVDAYGAHVEAGEELLESGRYFDAEERFTKALAHEPGDAFASAGRIHAQLGAGMYVSAALNLRSLIREHPEAAGIRYGRSVLPQSSRLKLIVSELRGKIKAQRIESDASLLLAYVGYQTRDADLTTEGLDDLDRHGADPALSAFLRRVWDEESR